MYTKNVKANRSSISIGQLLTVYANGEKVDTFEVKRIYFEPKTRQCWISKQRKKKFKTYFVTGNCRAR